MRSRGESEGDEHDGRFLEAEGTIMRATGVDPSGAGEASSSSCSSAGVDTETVVLSLRERVRWLEQRLSEKVSRLVWFGACGFVCAGFWVTTASMEWRRRWWICGLRVMEGLGHC